MGLVSLAQVIGELLTHGAQPELPVAIVDKGTRVDQKVVTGTLENIVQKAEEADLTGPAIVIIGSVVALRDQLTWYGSTS